MEENLNTQDKKKIIVIEDDTFLSEMLSGKLSKEEFDVKLFDTASGALESLRSGEQGKVDLILLDMVLPEMSGFEFLEKAKNDPKISSIPIIVLSNLGQDTEINKAKELGAKDYLIKAHFSLEEIMSKVKNLLEI